MSPRARRQRGEDRIEAASPPRSRRRSSCNSRARGPRRRRWCRHRHSGWPWASAPWRGGCRRYSRSCRHRSGCRRLRDEAADRRSVWSTTPAGTISHTARGFARVLANSASDAVPTALSLTTSATAFGDLSYTTQSWPPFRRRCTMFAPIRPRPIIPNCMFYSLISRTMFQRNPISHSRAARSGRSSRAIRRVP